MDNEPNRQRIIDMIGDDEPLIFWDGCDAAIIGLANRCGMEYVVAYSRVALTRLFVERDGMTVDEADEWIDFNIAGAYVGERTPMMVELFGDDEPPIFRAEER